MIARTSGEASGNHGERLRPTDIVTMILIVILLCSIVSCNMAYMQASASRVPFRNAALARSMQRSCPAIASRLDEYLADGKVTQEEDAVIDTIFDQQRSLPGATKTCRMPDPVPYNG